MKHTPIQKGPRCAFPLDFSGMCQATEPLIFEKCKMQHQADEKIEGKERE